MYQKNVVTAPFIQLENIKFPKQSENIKLLQIPTKNAMRFQCIYKSLAYMINTA
jgi:hypothetical protein